MSDRWPQSYDPRPEGRYRSFAGSKDNAPYDWPQDTLKVPNGFGNMPYVETLNRDMVGREFFGMSTSFVIGDGDLTTTVLPTPDDGDFWCENLMLAGYQSDGQTPAAPEFTMAYIQIQDIANNYKLFPTTGTLGDGAPVSPFLANATIYTASGLPQYAGRRAPWIQPYCFMRACGIKITMGSPVYQTPRIPITYYVSLSGWKEYRNAAR